MSDGTPGREPPKPATDAVTRVGQRVVVGAVVVFIVVLLAIAARWLAAATGVWPLA